MPRLALRRTPPDELVVAPYATALAAQIAPHRAVSNFGVLQGQRFMDATTTSASALIGIAPAIAFFLLFQRTLIRGITAGAVK